MQYVNKIYVLEKEIHIHVYDTQNGVNVMIEGGDKGHIGAVSVAAPGKELQTISFPGHKEEVICSQWAKKIAEVYSGPVVVEAGVHYDEIEKIQIEEIIEALNRERKSVLLWLKTNNSDLE